MELRREKVSLRALLLGWACVLVIAVVTPYSDLAMQGTWIGLTSFPISAFFVLCVLVGVNLLLRRWRRSWRTSEVLLVYCLALVAAGIPSFGWTGLLIPYIAGPFYFATPENNWAQILHPHIPRWLAPQNREAIVWLYEGAPIRASFPLGEWLLPLAAWSALGLSVYLVFFCLSSLLRKPWVEHERLVFPLVHLPIEMAKEEPDSVVPSFFRDPLMWLCFGIAFTVHILNGLRYYVPWLPSINVHLISLDAYFQQRPFSAVTPFWIRIPFSIIGLAYLLPLELSFSLWFCYFFFLAQQVIADAMGVPLRNVQAYPVKDFVAHQMIGGIIVYAIYGFWVAREHWQSVWRKAMTMKGGKSEREQRHSSAPMLPCSDSPLAGALRPSVPASVDDRDEALPYRTAFWGIWVGMLLISLWGWLGGAGFGMTLLLFVVYFLTHIIAVRLVCEGGMLYVQHPFRPINILLTAVGSSGIGTSRLPMLVFFDHLFMVDNRSPLMPTVMQGLRIGDAVSLNRRQLLAAMGISVVLAMVVSYWSYLRLMYQHGGHSLHQWFTTYYTRNLYCTWTSHLLTAGEPANLKALLTMLIGGGTMMGLLFLHRNFLWFPVSPIGYLMGASWPMVNFWFPVLMAWLLKAIVLRYGGGNLYRRLVLGFLGFIFAEFFSAGLWVLIDFFTGVRGHVIFSF